MLEDTRLLLWVGAYKNCIQLCIKAKLRNECIGSDYNEMAHIAAVCGKAHTALCCTALDWGATNLYAVLEAAEDSNNKKLVAYVKKRLTVNNK